MNKYPEKYRGWMLAVTFAEAGEWEAARAMIPDPAVQQKKVGYLERLFMAVAFAEEGMPEEALRIMEGRQGRPKGMGDFLDAIGLRGVPVTYAVLSAN